MSKSSSQPSDWSSNDNGMSPMDSSSGGGSSPQPVEYAAPDVANREQKAVNRSKFLVFFVLLLAVSGTASATYFLMKDEEQGDFEASVSCEEDDTIRITITLCQLMLLHNPVCRSCIRDCDGHKAES
eukprot:scaffold3541_cov116-Cylindrotheca_fusiformis.AAC.6